MSDISARLGLHAGRTLAIGAAAIFVAFVALPVVAIFGRVLGSTSLGPTLARPIVLEALRVSAITTLSALALALLIGTPLAYLLARHSFRGHELLDSLIELPMVLPPAVAGIGLLMAFGRRGVVRDPLGADGTARGCTTATVVSGEA